MRHALGQEFRNYQLEDHRTIDHRFEVLGMYESIKRTSISFILDRKMLTLTVNAASFCGIIKLDDQHLSLESIIKEPTNYLFHNCKALDDPLILYKDEDVDHDLRKWLISHNITSDKQIRKLSFMYNAAKEYKTVDSFVNALSIMYNYKTGFDPNANEFIRPEFLDQLDPDWTTNLPLCGGSHNPFFIKSKELIKLGLRYDKKESKQKMNIKLLKTIYPKTSKHDAINLYTVKGDRHDLKLLFAKIANHDAFNITHYENDIMHVITTPRDIKRVIN